MKLLLVLGNDDTCNSISLCVKPLGFELIRYNHVLKAMDNIEEIDPAALVISAKDFPRHWKIMVQFVRCDRPEDTCPIIILKGANLSTEEASKAEFLGVCLVAEALDSQEETGRLLGILSRSPKNEKRLTRARQLEKTGFVFITPDNVLVTGTVKDLSKEGLSFMPDRPLVNSIAPSMELRECSLRAGDSFLSPICRLSKTGDFFSLEFVSFPEGEQELLAKYMESL
jgi:hypothetical protein